MYPIVHCKLNYKRNINICGVLLFFAGNLSSTHIHFSEKYDVLSLEIDGFTKHNHVVLVILNYVMMQSHVIHTCLGQADLRIGYLVEIASSKA
jgi:hypothetical protein